MKDPVSAVVVSPDEQRARTWSAWLRGAGYATVTCPGPEAMDCPRLEGERCARRHLFDLAVIDVDPLDGAETWGGWPQRMCTKEPDDGRSVLVSSSDERPPFADEGIWLDGPPTPEALVTAVRRASQRGVPGLKP